MGALKIVTAPPPRSPEREALAVLIDRRSQTGDRLARINTALDETSPWELSGAVERAEAALAEAKANEPKRQVAKMLGDAQPEGQSVDDARQALATARTAHDDARRVRDALQQEQAEAEKALRFLDLSVVDAVAKVVASEPGIGQLLATYERKQHELAEIRQTIASVSAFVPHEHRHWDSIRSYPALRPDPAWPDAIRALQSDADAVLPA